MLRKLYIIIFIILSVTIFSQSQVNIDWVKTYSNGTTDTVMRAIDMAIDDSGAIYITGLGCSNIPNTTDIVIVKYDSQGNQKWVNRFNKGGTSTFNKPNSIKIDSAGNVYVAGVSTFGMLTLKYSSVGNLIWDKSYASANLNEAHDLEVDNSGNVYTTGISDYNGITCLHTTLKYNSSGNMLWMVNDTFNVAGGYGLSHLTLDKYNNVFVLFRSFDTLYYACKTIKYNTAGTKQWEQIYLGSNLLSGATPVDVQIDNNSNVLVQVYDRKIGYVVVKYSNNGGLNWISKYDNDTSSVFINSCLPSAMAIDGNDNVFQTGTVYPWYGGLDAFCTIKTNSIGNNIWIKNHTDSCLNWDMAYDIATDGSNNIYVTGLSCDDSTDNDIVTLRYDQNGNVNWKSRYQNVNSEEGYKVKVSPDGSVYAFGIQYVVNSNYRSQFVLIKYIQNLLGINEYTNGLNAVIYPNPNSGSFTIQTKGDVVLEIVNELGQVVRNIKLDASNNHQTNITGLADGVYCLKDKLSGTIVKNKIVVVR
ncbi:MAG: T9SS type A sorting domain-containing protein [Bacteroidetes bacterium]|nr:T9SS type A sorting domain-containing protein [Bacteroidota bacterium]